MNLENKCLSIIVLAQSLLLWSHADKYKDATEHYSLNQMHVTKQWNQRDPNNDDL